MALLEEYALTPDVFDSTSYSSDEVCGIHLQSLKEVLLTEGLVRDLRDGQWSSLFAAAGRSWHTRGNELLKKLAVQKRLSKCPSSLQNDPENDADWCREAILSHNETPVTGIITTDPTAQQFRDEPLVAPIDKLPNAAWWASRSPSIRLNRTIKDYIENLRLVLSHANSIQFIDPHINPRKNRYRDFLAILRKIPARRPMPRIEIHRRCYFEHTDRRDQLDKAEWMALFNSWAESLRNAGLSVEIFIWDAFHDRYLISNLVGISIPNGFDVTTGAREITTWMRLGRKEADDLRREFDPAANRHKLLHHFRIPA